MENSKKVNLWLLFAAIVLTAGGGWLLCWTVNCLYPSSPAPTVVSLALLAVFMYVFGASLMGLSAGRRAAADTFFSSEFGRYRHHSYSHSRARSNKIACSFLLIAAGVLLLCFNTGALNPDWKPFFFSWPMPFFIMGSMALCRKHFLSGAIMALAGMFFINQKAAIIYPDSVILERFAVAYWPALIIAFGVVVLLRSVSSPFHRKDWRYWRQFGKEFDSRRKLVRQDISEETNDGKINYSVTFGNMEQVMLAPVFKGGRAEVYFGAIELDLRRTSLAEGETALFLNVRFGAIEITVPDSWEIEIRSHALVGNVEDSRPKDTPKDRDRKLVVIARCSFGAIEIK